MEATDVVRAVQQNGEMHRSGGLIAVVGILVLALTACAPDRSPFEGESTESAAPSTSEPVAPGDIALTLDCTDVVSDDLLYEWGSGNWATKPNFRVVTGSSAETIVEHGGTACGWLNLTSGDTLTIAVGEFEPELRDTLKNERAVVATAVTDFGGEGYFVSAAGIGQADVFTGDYWITASSQWFGAAPDAAQLVASAVDAAEG